jgi:hypothetical protein
LLCWQYIEISSLKRLAVTVVNVKAARAQRKACGTHVETVGTLSRHLSSIPPVTSGRSRKPRLLSVEQITGDTVSYYAHRRPPLSRLCIVQLAKHSVAALILETRDNTLLSKAK